MKKPHQSISGLFFVFAVCTVALANLTSCGKDDSCEVPCYNGACAGKSCDCNPGYEGDSCTISSAEKFIGSYSAVDSCQTSTYNYTVTIAASTTLVNQLLITNFGEYGTTFLITADISGFNFTVPSQKVQGITLSGSGTLDTFTKKITVTYNATDELNQSDACSGVWIKQ